MRVAVAGAALVRAERIAPVVWQAAFAVLAARVVHALEAAFVAERRVAVAQRVLVYVAIARAPLTRRHGVQHL